MQGDRVSPPVMGYLNPTHNRQIVFKNRFIIPSPSTNERFKRSPVTIYLVSEYLVLNDAEDRIRCVTGWQPGQRAPRRRSVSCRPVAKIDYHRRSRLRMRRLRHVVWTNRQWMSPLIFLEIYRIAKFRRRLQIWKMIGMGERNYRLRRLSQCHSASPSVSFSIAQSREQSPSR